MGQDKHPCLIMRPARMTRPPTEAASPCSTLILIPISTAATHRPSFADNATAPSFPCRDFSHASPSAPSVGIDPDSSRPHLDPRLGLGRVGYREQWDSCEYGSCGDGAEHCFHHVAFLRKGQRRARQKHGLPEHAVNGAIRTLADSN